jgi:hypothetical protein
MFATINIKLVNWAHKTSLAPTTFYSSACTRHENESFICVLSVSILSLFRFNFGAVPTMWYFFFSYYYEQMINSIQKQKYIIAV